MGLVNSPDDYYTRVKHEARQDLAHIVAEHPAETCRELREQLKKALEYGDAGEVADALIAVIDVRHAHHELKEHMADAMAGTK